MSIFAWPESPFRFTQDCRPGLSWIAPAGLVLGGAVLFVCPVCSIDWSLRVERLEMMVLDLLLRTCASNRFALVLLGARRSACASRSRAELRSLTRCPSSIGRPVPTFLARRWLRVWWTGDVLEPGVLRLAPGEGTNVRRLDPWPRRHLQKSAGARCVGRRRRTRPDSRRAGHNVPAQVHRRTAAAG